MKRKVKVATAEQAAKAEFEAPKELVRYDKERDFYNGLKLGAHKDLIVPAGVDAKKYWKGVKNSLEKLDDYNGLVQLSKDGKIVRITKLDPAAEVEEDDSEDETEKGDQTAE